MPQEDTFVIDVAPDVEPGQTLLVGLSSPGVAGLTAADYLVRNRSSTEIGHVSPEELPSITPFENGTPRHHTRLYNLDDAPVTVLVSELFVPVGAARPFAASVLEWAERHQIEDIAVLHGVPFPHGPDGHQVFNVATPGYQRLRLEEAEHTPLQTGYLDAIPGELVGRSLGATAPPVGVFVTPTHPPGPDLEAAGRFLDTVAQLYGVDVDRSELQSLSESRTKHLEALAERMSALADDPGRRDEGQDRMFM